MCSQFNEPRFELVETTSNWLFAWPISWKFYRKRTGDGMSQSQKRSVVLKGTTEGHCLLSRDVQERMLRRIDRSRSPSSRRR